IEDFGTFNSFEKKYRLQGLDYGVQFDISVDGSDWLYDPNSWDDFDMWDQDSIPDGLPVKEYFGLCWHDNLTNMSLLDPSSLNNNPGIMEGCYDEGDDDNWGYIYLDDHTINTRYRYFIEYNPIDDLDEDGERVGLRYVWSDWSDEVSFGKDGNYIPLKMPETFSAPVISEIHFDDEGALYHHVSFAEDITDTELSLYVNGGAFQPIYYYTEACINDPSEKNFFEAYTANPVWMSDGNRMSDLSDYEDDIILDDDLRILFRGSLVSELLEKTSDYGYAVPQVKGLKASKVKNNQMKLSWKAVEDADFYEIYDSDNKLVATTKKTNYTVKKLKANTKYTFKVRAVYNKNFVGLFAKVSKKTKK
ncbi:MAG: fibronectin type III domain-containing protein, partial [Lachnospiraceae bacterium]|nr:fibronectin type III domain-containing protein [Lachnospiraceae bacterium]